MAGLPAFAAAPGPGWKRPDDSSAVAERATSAGTLDLSGNSLAELPEWLGDLAVLTSLRLAGNQLIEDPIGVPLPGSLTHPALAGNRLATLHPQRVPA